MTDRELLELAAKAAGEAYQEFVEPGSDLGRECGEWGYVVFAGMSHIKFWNPLTDDRDALRLAVKLEIVVAPYVSYAMADSQHEDAKGDINAATRRAIVRAAAAIGKQHD